jgi:hypothetical protein
MREYRAKNREKRTEYNRRWREANSEKSAGYSRAYADRHPDRLKETRVKHAPKARERRLKKLYGLTQEQYDAMVVDQGGCCAICKRTGLVLHVDHDHRTGAVRALLCVTCNNHLGIVEAFGDRARAYLSRFAGVSL